LKIRHEFLVDAFGKYLFWAMSEAMQTSKVLVESSDERKKLGRVFQKVYTEAAEHLDPVQQKIAFDLAERIMEKFAQNLLLVFQARGITFRLGDEHAIQFRLTAEIHETENLEVVYEDVINRDGRKSFGDYWGHWLRLNSIEKDQRH
jgi:hypothetical protein